MMERILRLQGRRTLWGCLLYLFASVLVALIFVFSIGLAWLVPVSNDMRVIVWAVSFASLGAIALTGVVLAGLVAKGRRDRHFDEALAPFRLTGTGYLSVGRQYHGQVGSRQLDIFFSKGPHFQVFLDVRAGTRLGAGQPNALGRFVAINVHREEILVEGATWAAWASDGTWGRAFCADPEIRALTSRLLEPADGVELPSLLVQPDALCLNLAWTRLEHLDTERVRSLVQDLRILADRVETLPPPATLERTSRLEQINRKPRQGPLFLVGVAAATLVFVLLLSGVITALVLVSAE